MKKLLLIILSCILLTTAFTPYASADSLKKDIFEIIPCENGAWIEKRITIQPTRGNTVTASSDYKYYDGDIKWSATLTGSFTYDGVTSTCTSSNLSFSISDSAWYVVSQSAYRSGNTAYGDYTMGARILGITYKTTSFNMSISCDKDGNVS